MRLDGGEQERESKFVVLFSILYFIWGFCTLVLSESRLVGRKWRKESERYNFYQYFIGLKGWQILTWAVSCEDLEPIPHFRSYCFSGWGMDSRLIHNFLLDWVRKTGFYWLGKKAQLSQINQHLLRSLLGWRTAVLFIHKASTPNATPISQKPHFTFVSPD